MSDNVESSKQFYREFVSLSFETSRVSKSWIGAEKIKKYGDHRILAKNIWLLEYVVSVRAITIDRLNEKV